LDTRPLYLYFAITRRCISREKRKILNLPIYEVVWRWVSMKILGILRMLLLEIESPRDRHDNAQHVLTPHSM